MDQELQNVDTNCEDYSSDDENPIPTRLQVDDIQNSPDSQHSDEQNIGVLPDDHPLLEKFQKSLREHLLRVQSQLINEISEMDHKIQNKEKVREDVGCKLYDMQQEIRRQNDVLDDYSKQIQDIHEKRIVEETRSGPLKKEYEDKLGVSKKLKRSHNERLMELSRLQALEMNIKTWTKEVDDEVITAKRTVSKDNQAQQKNAEEKKKMDMLLFNLDAEVRKREHELQGINDQITEQKHLINVLNNSFSDACADLDALQQEHKRLTQSWGEVIISIQHRDKILHQTKIQLENEKEQIKLAVANIEGTKKTAAREMEQNERLESFKTRISEDLNNLTRQADKEAAVLETLEIKHEQLLALLDQTEKDFKMAKEEGNALEVQLRRIQGQLDKQSQKKFKIEEEILLLAQEQLTTDKATEYRMKLLSDSQSQRRNLELTLSQTEKNLSISLLDLEKWKGIVIRLREENDITTNKFNEFNNEASSLAKTVKEYEKSSNIKFKQIDSLTKKLDILVKASDGQEISPTEMKINELERQIHESYAEIEKLQQFWLMMQGHVVNITGKRSAQMNEMQIIRKQLMINNQKSLRVDNQLAEIGSYGQEIAKNIKNLSSKIELLGNKLFQKKKSHETDEHNCEMLHLELVERLRETEMSVLEIEQEITDLLKEIEYAKEMILEKNREALSWETKYKMIEETLRWFKSEKAMESEIGNMKAEIHRMEIRFNQLKRAQEKLVQDLEHCVMHREQIFDSAMVHQKLEGNQSRSRLNIQHKLNEIKNKIKSTQSDVGNAEKSLSELNSERQYVMADICCKQEEIDNEKVQSNLIIAELEQGMLLKYQNLENIVRKQQRAKRYRVLASMRTTPKIAKSEPMLNATTQKQREINQSLFEITQLLINDYPEKKFPLLRILQTLKDD